MCTCTCIHKSLPAHCLLVYLYDQVLELLWNLAHRDDCPTDTMDHALNAHIKILDYSCSQVRQLFSLHSGIDTGSKHPSLSRQGAQGHLLIVQYYMYIPVAYALLAHTYFYIICCDFLEIQLHVRAVKDFPPDNLSFSYMYCRRNSLPR